MGIRVSRGTTAAVHAEGPGGGDSATLCGKGADYIHVTTEAVSCKSCMKRMPLEELKANTDEILQTVARERHAAREAQRPTVIITGSHVHAEGVPCGRVYDDEHISGVDTGAPADCPACLSQPSERNAGDGSVIRVGSRVIVSAEGTSDGSTPTGIVTSLAYYDYEGGEWVPLVTVEHVEGGLPYGYYAEHLSTVATPSLAPVAAWLGSVIPVPTVPQSDASWGRDADDPLWIPSLMDMVTVKPGTYEVYCTECAASETVRGKRNAAKVARDHECPPAPETCRYCPAVADMEALMPDGEIVPMCGGIMCRELSDDDGATVYDVINGTEIRERRANILAHVTDDMLSAEGLVSGDVRETYRAQTVASAPATRICVHCGARFLADQGFSVHLETCPNAPGTPCPSCGARGVEHTDACFYWGRFPEPLVGVAMVAAARESLVGTAWRVRPGASKRKIHKGR